MRRPPRVTIAARLFPPEAGAAAFRLGALAAGLAQDGAVVRVVTTVPPPGARGAQWRGGDHEGVTLSRWPVLRDEGGNVRGYVQFASFDGPLFWRLLLAPRPDVVVVEPPPTTGVSVRLACALRRVPYVYYAGDVSSTAAEGIGVSPRVVAVLRRVEAWAMGGAARVLAVSDGVAQEVARLTAAPDRVTVVGTGVDTTVFHPPTSGPDVTPTGATPAGGSRPAPTFVYAGTMSELHGAEVFVRAFGSVAAAHPDARLVMYGQGTEVAALRRLAHELAPGQVELPGVVSGERVAVELAAATAGLASLHPKMGYDYAFPTKMFATTACGAPVIYAGPGPGQAMVSEHRLGWACDWDVAEVGAAMRDALTRPWSSVERARLTAWTEEHASQRAVAAAASAAVLEVVQRSYSAASGRRA
ncbi:MAG TPA: glycosyltransferase [Dermatophilaceae bacterium]|jgi:glycosyltransferase involved in cell wall biosynthesis|nr:glycosyltransferase [Dermatophilaceae bacterium]